MDGEEATKTPIRFSQFYVSDQGFRPDSARARVRVTALFAHLPHASLHVNYASQIALEIGVVVPSTGFGSDWTRFFNECSVDVILDAVTVIYQSTSNLSVKRNWLEGLRTIFAEERLAYSISPSGEVRHLVDKEFSRNLASTISSLSAPRYASVRADLERSLTLLTERPPSKKQAIRAAFDASEVLFRLAFPKAPRLGASEAKANIEPLLPSLLAGDKTAQMASGKVLLSFMDWVDAALSIFTETGPRFCVEKGPQRCS